MWVGGGGGGGRGCVYACKCIFFYLFTVLYYFSTEYEEELNFGSGFNKSGVAKSGVAKTPPVAYKEGPLPTISDSVFSLIILVNIQIVWIPGEYFEPGGSILASYHIV